MGWLSYIFPRTLYQGGTLYNTHILIREAFGRNELLVNNIQQTGAYTHALWKRGLHSVLTSSSVSNVLVFGVGGGTVFHLFAKAFPEARMTGVDVDGEIISLGKKYFGLQALPHLSLVHKDARIFVHTAKKKSYDFILIDMYIGNDVPEFATKKAFLAEVGKLLHPGGTMVINYFSEKKQNKKTQMLFDTLALLYAHVEKRQVLRNIFLYVLK